MADKSYIVKSSGQGQLVTALKRFLIVEATVSQNDTLTISEFTAVDNAKAMSLDDGADAAVSVDTNVITVTEVVTDEKIIVLVVGV